MVRATSITQGLRGAFRSIVGGNVAAYEEVCEAARMDAFKRMALPGGRRVIFAVLLSGSSAGEAARDSLLARVASTVARCLQEPGVK